MSPERLRPSYWPGAANDGEQRPEFLDPFTSGDEHADAD